MRSLMLEATNAPEESGSDAEYALQGPSPIGCP